ncbi:redoxin domain-containing protein [Candidatus Villigracilis affinis]|uniref:peroxiredoxin family protein n=1 Tax=Candidatus Villigracilis affinis TaxID=3140682 RepID=UPI001E091171|nr:redoxin domain-containing protein [Anaerolineales bacterium]
MQINQSAPDFELPDLDGNLHRLSHYRGRIVIVNFWSCECPHSERTDKAIDHGDAYAMA